MRADPATQLIGPLWPPMPNKRQLLWIFVPVALGYGAELTQFTFAYDYYYNQIMLSSSVSAYTRDGRYLAELLKNLTFHSTAPFLFLALALAALILASLIFIRALQGDAVDGYESHLIIAAPVIVLFPFLFDIFSFVDVRISVALGFLFAALGVSLVFRRPVPRTYILGTFCLDCSLALYQSAFNVALIMILLTVSPIFLARME